jgi:Holliday junction resolvase-like predicted endonuclease
MTQTIMTNSEKGKLGEKYVADYLRSAGFDVKNSPDNGSDLLAAKGKQIIKIEVKTTSNLTGGIPDMHTTEFFQKDGKWLFVADYLYIVRLDDKAIPTQLDIISKTDVDKYADSHKTVTRVRTTKLDKDLNSGKIGTTVKL